MSLLIETDPYVDTLIQYRSQDDDEWHLVFVLLLLKSGYSSIIIDYLTATGLLIQEKTGRKKLRNCLIWTTYYHRAIRRPKKNHRP